MSVIRRTLFVILILIIPVLLSLLMFKVRPKTDWERAFGRGTSWKLRQATGLQRYELAAGEAEAIIEIDAARLGVGIRFADRKNGLSAARELCRILECNGQEYKGFKHSKSKKQFVYSLGKSVGRIGLRSSQMTAPIGAIVQVIKKHAVSSVVVMRSPKYASMSYGEGKMAPAFSGTVYNWYKLDGAAVESVMVSAEWEQTVNKRWIVYVLSAFALSILGSIVGVFHLGNKNSLPATRLRLMNMTSAAPAYAGAAALLLLAVVGYYRNDGDVLADLWIRSNLPLGAYHSLVPGIVLNLFIIVIAIQGCIGGAYKRELVLSDNSISNDEKFKRIVDPGTIWILSWFPGIMFLNMFSSGFDLFAFQIDTLKALGYFLVVYCVILLQRFMKMVSLLRVELGLVDMQWLNSITTLLDGYPVDSRRRKIELDLGEDAMKKPCITAQYIGPLIISGGAGNSLTINELRFLALDKLLFPVKRIAGMWQILTFSFVSITVIFVLSSLFDIHSPPSLLPLLSLAGALGLVILISLFQLPAIISSPYPTINRYRRILDMTGDYRAARSALVKFTGRTASGRLKSHKLSRLWLQYKLRILSEARQLNMCKPYAEVTK